MRTADRRWSLFTALTAISVLVAGAFSAPGTAAAPLQQAPTCTWERLASGETLQQHTLVPLPEKGVLVFGGADLSGGANPEEVPKSDVRQLDLTTGAQGTWTKLSPTGNGPGNRAHHSAVLRQQGSVAQMVTFGGLDEPQGGGTFTWRSPLLGGGTAVESRQREYSPMKVQDTAFRLTLGGNAPVWDRITGAGTLKRTDHSAIYNPDDDSMIVFGGLEDEPVDTVTDDLWRLTLGDAPDWDERQITGGPSKRFSHSAVYDPNAKRMIIFGGTQDWESGMNDAWALDLAGGWANARWVALSPTGRAPSARFDHGAVFLPNLNWMLAYGGSPDGRREFDDLYALDLSTDPPKWQEVRPGGTRPTGLYMLAAAYNPALNKVVFQGGAQGGSTRRLTWGLKCEGAVPTATATRASPTPTEPPPATTEPPTNTPTSTRTPTNTSPPPTFTRTPTPSATPTDTATPRPPAIFMPRLFYGE